MKNYNAILKETANISALSSCKTDKYKWLTGEEILPHDQSRMIEEEVKFTYSPLRKAFEKQTKKTEDQKRKQVKALKFLKPFEH